jgi:phosphatidylinositol-3-phosphatase
MKMTTIALSLTAALLASSAFAQEQASTARMPHFDHVFLIMMENHAYAQIIDNPNAPFINQMAHTANLATNFYGVGHPSLTNYLEVVGGSNFSVINDHSPDWHNTLCVPNLVSHVPSDESASTGICPIAGTGYDAATPAVDTTNEGTPAVPVINTPIASAPATAMTIADQLVASGKSWKSYQESLPATGADNVNYSDGIFSNLSAVNQADVQKVYAVKHNPFAYFANVQENTDPKNGLNNMVGFDGLNGLYADLRAGKAPDFSFIAPNQCHDMHGIGNGGPFCGYEPNPTLVQMGDASVKQLVSAIKGSASWQEGNNAIIVLWDENDYSAVPNQVVTLVETNYGVKGVASAQPYNHFSLLKTLEAGFGLTCLNHACDDNVKMMSDLFADDHHNHH